MIGARYLSGGDTLVESRKENLILLWGQSNATGMDDYANITNANGYVDPYAAVTLSQYITSGTTDPLAFVVNGAVATLQPRFPAGQPNLGPELSMMRHIDRVRPGKWRVAKWGINSSELQGNWLPTANFPTSPAGGPNLFTQALNDAAAQAAAAGATVRALVWVQGEQDALNASPTANYQANLIAFIAAVRAVYPELPVVISRIPAASPESGNATVQAAQAAVVAATAQSALVNTDDLIPLITTYHFSATNLVTLGHRLASAVLGLLGITDSYPSVPWTTDGDGIAFPQNATEWAAVLAAAGIASGGPFRATDCTVASGNLTDLIGAVPLVPSGTGITYQTAVPGFTRTGVSTTDAATGKFSTTDASLPDLSTTSLLTLTYVRVNVAPGTFRNLTSAGTTVKAKMSIKSGNLIDHFDGATNNTIGTAHPVGAVRPFILQRDHTNQIARFASNQETFTVTWASTVTGKQLEIVGEANGAPNAVTMYEASFKGSAAELTSAQINSLLKTLGWTMQW